MTGNYTGNPMMDRWIALGLVCTIASLTAQRIEAQTNTQLTPAQQQALAQQQAYARQQAQARQQTAGGQPTASQQGMAGQQLTPEQQRSLAQRQALARQQGAGQPIAVQNNAGQPNAGQPNAGQPRPAGAPQPESRAPFPPLMPHEQARLDQILLNWQSQTQGTKTLTCDFSRWHFDQLAAPAGVHASKSVGAIKYAAPDKGLFKVEQKQFYAGIKDNQPQFAAQPGKFGEWWVCTGKELLEYDRTNEKCTIQVLPQHLQGTAIFNSPLPFVFNSDAQQIKQKFWVCEGKAPDADTILINAWPKTQENRAQYKLVQVALGKDFLPKALIMFAPNFHPQKNPVWDQYEFANVKRNSLGAGVSQFLNWFIPQQPPKHWKVMRDNFLVEPPQVAGGVPPQQPAGNQPIQNR